jgi:DNA-binding beta-propeller fold protein YncE
MALAQQGIKDKFEHSRHQELARLAFALLCAMLMAGCGSSALGATAVPSPGTTPSIPFVSTLAGSGNTASVDGTGRQASFDAPSDIALDPRAGLLYVLEPSTGSARKLTVQGTVATLTRSLAAPAALAFNPADGNLYATEPASSSIDRIGTNGTVSNFMQVPVSASLPPQILGKIAIDTAGNLNITESRAGDLIVVTPNRNMTTTAVAPGALGVCFDSKDGNVYVLNQAYGEIEQVSSAGSHSFIASALLQGGAAITYDATNDSFYVTNPSKNQVLHVAGGVVSVFAGTGLAAEADGPASSAEFNAPTGIVYDLALHALFVTDSAGNTVREITSFE